MPLEGRAFAPSAISNFFVSHYDGGSAPLALRHSGATGGGYALEKGVTSTAWVERDSRRPGLRVVVNGNPDYKALTTSRAVNMLLESHRETACRVELYQDVGVRIGCGFGTSAASALSGVMAVASALALRISREEVAYFAHAAEILCNTGLGTVAVIYKYAGAGLIVRPGAPGVAEVNTVSVPRDVRIVTASLAPLDKGLLLSSPDVRQRINKLGVAAIERAADLSIEGLAKAGEFFSDGLGIASPEVQRAIRAARSAGALGASQNMIGQAAHAVVWERDAPKVAAAMAEAAPAAEVRTFCLAERAAVTLPLEVSLRP